MVGTYPNIVIRPGISNYPLVNKGKNSINAATDADAAAFQRILDEPAKNSASASAGSAAAKSTASSAAPDAGSAATGHLTFTGFLKDLFDIINPLQHIPVVSAIYQHITGDKISPEAEFIGDALYGGPIGGAVAAANIAYQEETGHSLGQTVIAGLTKPSATPAGAATMVADATGQRAAQPGAQIMVARNLNPASSATGGQQTAGAAQTASNASTALPASGAQAAAGPIVWEDNPAPAPSITSTAAAASKSFQVASVQKVSLLSPPSTTSGTIEEGSASPSTAPPVLHPKGAASTIVLQSQEAPVGKARKAMPPELIAQKMMMGLQKYAAMKQTSLAPSLSALY